MFARTVWWVAVAVIAAFLIAMLGLAGGLAWVAAPLLKPIALAPAALAVIAGRFLWRLWTRPELGRG